jgi:DNA processing protein
MSAATIVMQTDLIGGTMHTVRYAVLQERPLIAPVPQGAHAKEPKSRGILALTQRTGTDLARLVDAGGVYAEQLTRKFADRSIALSITGRDDYDALLDTLEGLAVANTTHKSPAPQLGFWDT